MGEPRERHDGPVDPQPEELGEAGPWKNVPKPTMEELTAPSTEIVDTPQMPLVVKVVGLLLVAALLILAAWLGLSLGGSTDPEPSPTPSIDETLWVMETPTTMGNYVRGEVTSTPAGTRGDRDIVTAKYSNGADDKIVLLLSRPEDNLDTYLENAGVENTEPVAHATCGTSVDNSAPVCARVVDETAIAVVGINDQDFVRLASTVESFYAALK